MELNQLVQALDFKLTFLFHFYTYYLFVYYIYYFTGDYLAINTSITCLIHNVPSKAHCHIATESAARIHHHCEDQNITIESKKTYFLLIFCVLEFKWKLWVAALSVQTTSRYSTSYCSHFKLDLKSVIITVVEKLIHMACFFLHNNTVVLIGNTYVTLLYNLFG